MDDNRQVETGGELSEPKTFRAAMRQVLNRDHMEIANFWLPIFGGGILCAIAICAWFAGQKPAGVWFGFGGCVCLLLLATLQIQNYISQPVNEISPAVALDQRPWVSLDVELAEPLRYDDKGWQLGFRWHSLIRYKIKNTGKTPAIKVQAFAKMFPFTLPHFPPGAMKDGIPQGHPIPGTEPMVEFKQIFKALDLFALVEKGTGELLAPGEERTSFFGLNGEPARFEQAQSSEAMYSGNFLLVVGVSYGFTFDVSRHHIGKAYQLFKRTGSQKIDLVGEFIPLADLGFSPHPFGGSVTD